MYVYINFKVAPTTLLKRVCDSSILYQRYHSASTILKTKIRSFGNGSERENTIPHSHKTLNHLAKLDYVI